MGHGLGTPAVLLADATRGSPEFFHAEMLKNIGELEQLISKLHVPKGPEETDNKRAVLGHNKPPEAIDSAPLDTHDIEQIKSDIASLRALPPRPPQPPLEAVEIQSRWSGLLKKVAKFIGTELAKTALKETIWPPIRDVVNSAVTNLADWLRSLDLF